VYVTILSGVRNCELCLCVVNGTGDAEILSDEGDDDGEFLPPLRPERRRRQDSATRIVQPVRVTLREMARCVIFCRCFAGETS